MRVFLIDRLLQQEIIFLNILPFTSPGPAGGLPGRFVAVN
jgi:hypothetical protein